MLYKGLEIISLPKIADGQTTRQPTSQTTSQTKKEVKEVVNESQFNLKSQLIPLACLVGGVALYFLSNGTTKAEPNLNVFVP